MSRALLALALLLAPAGAEAGSHYVPTDTYALVLTTPQLTRVLGEFPTWTDCQAASMQAEEAARLRYPTVPATHACVRGPAVITTRLSAVHQQLHPVDNETDGAAYG